VLKKFEKNLTCNQPMKLLFRWMVNAAALLGIAYVLPGFQLDGILLAILAALVLGLVNALVRPLLVVLTLPITVMTLGLFLLVVNGLVIWLASSLVPGFSIDSFFTAMLAAIFMWVVGWITSWLLKTE